MARKWSELENRELEPVAVRSAAAARPQPGPGARPAPQQPRLQESSTEVLVGQDRTLSLCVFS